MYSGSTKQTKWPFEVALKTESVFCGTAPWDYFGDKFKLSFLCNLVITNE